MKNFKFFLLVIIVIISALIARSYLKKSNFKNFSKRKVLNLALNGRPKSLDPIKCNESYGFQEISKIYECLFEYEYLKRPSSLKPNLLEDMPIISKDQLSYTFTLKKGILFHDNPNFQNKIKRELDSKDVIFSLKRMADPKQMGLSFSFIANKIKGLDEWRVKYKSTNVDYNENIEGFEIIDKYSFKIHLKTPFPLFLNVLAIPCFSIVPREVFTDKINLNLTPIGTGPFMLKKEYNPHSNKIVYIKNPKFREKYFPTEGHARYKSIIEEYGGKRIPFIDKIVTKILPEISPRWLELKKGKIDILDITNDGNLGEVIDKGNILKEKYRSMKLRIETDSQSRTTFFLLNNARQPFNHLEIRQAFSMAFNRLEYNRLFNNDAHRIAQSMIPPGINGYNENLRNDLYQSNKSNIDQRNKLIMEAKKLVEKIYPLEQERPWIAIETLSNTIEKQGAEFFKRCVEKIGFRATINANTWPELIKKANNKSYMIMKIGWSAFIPDGYELLQWFYGPQAKEGANYANFFNKDYDNDFEKISNTTNLDLRKKLQEQLNAKLMKYCPIIFLNHIQYFALVRHYIKNYIWSSKCCYGIEQYVDIKS